MIQAEGEEFDELTRAIDEFDDELLLVVGQVMAEVAKSLGKVDSPDDQASEQVQPSQMPGEALVSLDTLSLIASLWAVQITKRLGPALVKRYLAGAHAVYATLSVRIPQPQPTPEELLNTTLAETYLAAANNRMVRFDDVLWELSRAQLLEGFMEGESIQQLRDRLRIAVPELSAPRASTIARTEIVSASNAGSLALPQVMGFTGTKTWLATEDSRTRPAHREADGQTVDINGLFLVGGFPLNFPGDPAGPPGDVINCRCTITYDLNNEPMTAAGGLVSNEWIGVLCVEGSPTGDRRMFSPGSISWADLPLPLLWQKETQDGHDGAVVVGNITGIAREGNLIIGRGTFDMTDPDGARAYEKVRDGYAGGVSIDADNFTANDVEYVYGPGITDEGGPALDMTRFHAGRIRGATMCAIPAFVEARISVMPEEMMQEPVINDVMVAAAIKAHDTKTVDTPWDAAAQVKKLDSPMSVETARNMYAWMDDSAVKDGKIAKDGCKFPHHEVNADGTPGAANLPACSAGIAALHGARGGTDIPEDEKRGVYNHLATHLKDGGRTPPKFSNDTEEGEYSMNPLTAAAYVLTIPDVPPVTWFDEPSDVDMKGALTVTDEGRVYGYLAPAGVAHRSFAKKVTVPMGNVDYSLYMGRETITATGERVVTGALTMDCGHAATSFRDPTAAMDHYDNSCSIVATVRIGENKNGVWIAGSLVPGLTGEQIVRMMACQLSGDWRPHRNKNGWREFAGALLVPVPGFAMSRTEASVRMEEGALVASAVPVEYELTSTSCGCKGETSETPPVSKPSPNLDVAAKIVAASVGLDLNSRASKLRDMIGTTTQRGE